MEKERLKRVLIKANKLDKGKEIALANEFVQIDEKIEKTTQGIADIKEELKKKLDEELSYEVDEQKIVDSVLSKVVIPPPIKGEDGKDYVITEKDRQDIASTIVVPVVEKIVEKTEVIREMPIVTNEVKEVAVKDTPIEIVDKLNTLHEVVKPEVIIGWGDMLNKIRNKVPENFDVRIGVSKTEIKRLTDRIVVLESAGGSSGGVGAWLTPPEAVAADGSVVVFTVGATPPTDVISDGAMLYDGFGYTYAAGQITLDNGPTQFIRYR